MRSLARSAGEVAPCPIQIILRRKNTLGDRKKISSRGEETFKTGLRNIAVSRHRAIGALQYGNMPMP